VKENRILKARFVEEKQDRFITGINIFHVQKRINEQSNSLNELNGFISHVWLKKRFRSFY
jgi:hypothetical protein